VCLQQDGYRLVRANQLLGALAAFDTGEITFRALRIYLGSFEMLAIREAAHRSRVRRRSDRPQFRRSELGTYLALAPEASIARDLSLLKRAGLLTFSENALLVADDPPHGVHLHPLLGGRGANRLVPVPRRMLRFLAACSKPALVKTIIAYLLRGLSLDASGAVQGKGTAKISWICALTGISERAARSARAELIQMGWITKDTGSVQRKLNRDGAYFVIDTAWQHAAKRFAPLAVRSRVRFAPLPERLETLPEQKNQKLAVANETGFCRKASSPNLRNVRPEDIRKPSRLRELFDQATSAGWFARTEANLLNFAAAAVRANRVSGNAVRVFLGITRKRLWHHLSISDEERARTVLLGPRAGRNRIQQSGAPCTRRIGHGPAEPGEEAQSEIRGLLEKVLANNPMPEVGAAGLWE
jgi:hypothetical protein